MRRLATESIGSCFVDGLARRGGWHDTSFSNFLYLSDVSVTFLPHWGPPDIDFDAVVKSAELKLSSGMAAGHAW